MLRKAEKNAKIAKSPADKIKKITPLQKLAQRKELRIIAALGRAQKHSRSPEHSRKAIAAEMGIQDSQLSRILCITSLNRSQASLFQCILLAELLGFSIELNQGNGHNDSESIDYEGEPMTSKNGELVQSLREALRHERATNKFLQGIIRKLERDNSALKKDAAQLNSGGNCAAKAKK